MTPPSILVVPPLLMAMLVFGYRFHQIDPLRRITDPNMLACIGSVGLAIVYAALQGVNEELALFSWFACISGWALLIGGVVWTWKRPPVRDSRPDPEPQA